MIFSTYYGSLRFITVFATARHLFLSWDRSVQSTSFQTISSRSIAILSSHLLLRLPSGFFPRIFPTKLCIHLSCLPYVTHAPLVSSFFWLSDKYLVRITEIKLLILQSSPVLCYLLHAYMKLSLSLVKKMYGFPASTQVEVLCSKVCHLQSQCCNVTHIRFRVERGEMRKTYINERKEVKDWFALNSTVLSCGIFFWYI